MLFLYYFALFMSRQPGGWGDHLPVNHGLLEFICNHSLAISFNYSFADWKFIRLAWWMIYKTLGQAAILYAPAYNKILNIL